MRPPSWVRLQRRAGVWAEPTHNGYFRLIDRKTGEEVGWGTLAQMKRLMAEMGEARARKSQRL